MAYGYGKGEAFSSSYSAIKVDFSTTGTLYAMLHGSYYGIILLNSLDNPIAVSLDGGTSVFAYLASAEPLFVNFYSMGLALKKGNITAYYTGSAPTSGSLRGTLIYKPAS